MTARLPQVQDDQATQDPTSFDAILQATEMPEPGPGYFEARRRLWLTAPPNHVVSKSRVSIDRKKLETMLASPDRNHAVDAWRTISSGQALKRNIPMDYLIRFIHAAWLRDKTWPAGMVVPDSDDNQSVNQPDTRFPLH